MSKAMLAACSVFLAIAIFSTLAFASDNAPYVKIHQIVYLPESVAGQEETTAFVVISATPELAGRVVSVRLVQAIRECSAGCDEDGNLLIETLTTTQPSAVISGKDELILLSVRMRAAHAGVRGRIRHRAYLRLSADGPEFPLLPDGGGGIRATDWLTFRGSE